MTKQETITAENLYLVTKKLIGNIHPAGCTTRDKDRLNNMQLACGLVDKLLTDIDDVAYQNKDSHEGSVKEIADYAKGFYDKIGITE